MYSRIWPSLWLCGKESTCQCRRLIFDPWVGKIPCWRKWQPTPVFLPEKFQGQRTLVGYSPWGCKSVRHNLVTKQQLRIIQLISQTRLPSGASSKEPTCQCRKHKEMRVQSLRWEDPWKRQWQPTPIFLPGESVGQRSPMGYSPQVRKESDRIEAT